MSDRMNRSGGGIVFGGEGGAGRSGSDQLANGLRRRWASGIVIVVAPDGEEGFRGITATSFMVVSETPLVVALAVATGSEFGALLAANTRLSMSVLESSHEFLAERFAGRAPLPDRRLTGIGHQLHSGLPIITNALAWLVGSVISISPQGDHHLVLVSGEAGALGEDTDDPLLRYEGRYRRLEAG